MSNEDSKYDGVFISFSHKDEKIAENFYKKLTAAGKKVFYYRESQVPGDNYKQRIDEALHNCKDFLLICTVNSAASDPVKYECKKFNAVFKDNKNEKRLFIFEGKDFEPSYVPKIKGWNEIQRCNNFRKQINAILERQDKERQNFIFFILIFLILVVCGGGLAYYKIQQSHTQKEKQPQTNGSIIDKGNQSQTNEPIIPKEENKLTLPDAKNNADDVKQEKLRSEFYNNLNEKKFKEAETALNNLKKSIEYKDLKKEYDANLQKYIEHNFDTTKEENFGNWIITMNKKSGLWGVRDKYGNILKECIYQNQQEPMTPGDSIVIFILNENGKQTEIRYDKNLKEIKEEQ